MAKKDSKHVFAPDLITIIKYDKSIESKCKAITDLGNVHDMELIMAYQFLKKITTQKGYEPEVYNSAVQDKAKGTMDTLKPRITTLPDYDKRPELQQLVSG